MSIKTKALIEGLNKMLKDRGSMTVEEANLLKDVVNRLKEHESLRGEKKLQNGAKVLGLLLKFFMNPAISDRLSELVSSLIDKLF